MLKQKRLTLAVVFGGGVLLGVALAVLWASTRPDASWATLARVAIALLVFAIPLGYLIWMVAGAVQSVRPRERTEDELAIYRGASRVRHVLVSAGGGRHAQLGLRLAAQLAGNGHGVTLLRVIPPEKEEQKQNEMAALRRMALAILGADCPVEVKVMASPSVVDAVLEEANKGYDLLVIGAAEEWGLHHWIVGTIPDVIAERAPCPVMMVRATMS